MGHSLSKAAHHERIWRRRKAACIGDVSTRWTEEFQANIYEHQFVMLNQIPQLRE